MVDDIKNLNNTNQNQDDSQDEGEFLKPEVDLGGDQNQQELKAKELQIKKDQQNQGGDEMDLEVGKQRVVPGPSEQGEDKDSSNQADQLAFNGNSKQSHGEVGNLTSITKEDESGQFKHRQNAQKKQQDKNAQPSGQDVVSTPNGLKITSHNKQEELQDKMQEISIEAKESEVKNKADDLGLGYINLKALPIMPEALRMIDRGISKEKQVICFMFRQHKEIRLAAVELNQEVKQIIDELKQLYSEAIKIYLTSQASFEAAFKQYAALPKIIEEQDSVELLEEDLKKNADSLKDLNELKHKINQVSMTEVFSMILAAAIKVEASDIHIEAEEHGIQIRFRVDGVLHEVAKLNRESWDKLISRIKLNAKIKINVKDKPQDGRFNVEIKGSSIDFRVSTIPTAYGESVVMRILYHDKIRQMTLDNLGLMDYNKALVEKEIQKPNGMIVVTGPTGSGKTTTLYAVLSQVNSEDNKIITVEDPVEYKLEGINQSEINSDRGYTFAKALRSIVRQDPDVILVGEIRDKETTDIALNAALTGHLVFTTLHTNNAAGAVPRFLALGGKPYLLAPAMNVSIAQRLVRTVCGNCKQKEELTGQGREFVNQELAALPESYKDKYNINLENVEFYKGSGCEQCSGLGYKGQVGIFEILLITDDMRDVVLADQISEHKIYEMAIRNGMITMRQDGILKALKGVTSVEEVLRVTGN